MEDTLHHITLGGKIRTVADPPLGQVRRILKLYNALARVQGDDDAAADQRMALIRSLLAVVFGNQRLGAVSADELAVFIVAIPDLCGLDPAKTGAQATGDDAFGQIYAHLAASYGWTYDYIDQHVTMSQLKDMSDYAKRNPPTHQLVAAYLGYEYQDKNAGSQFLAAIAAQAKAAKPNGGAAKPERGR